MKVVWREEPWNGEPVILSGDIGGTNSNLALVLKRDNDLRILLELSAPSADLEGIGPLVACLLDESRARYPELRPTLGCISGAGPIESNCCSMSNLNWEIDGDALAEEFGFPIWLINDFEAISFGVPLLDLEDPAQVTMVPHSCGSIPEAEGDVRLIVGAGTGLGVSVMLGDGETARALPSEGGHAGFSPFDDETREIFDWISRDGRKVVEIEDLLSGKGIATLFEYFLEFRKPKMDEILNEILDARFADRPGLISRYASSHSVCGDVIRLFVKIYGRTSADLAAIMLPKRGLFLAGGIVGKNESFFLEEYQFTSFFEQNECLQVENVLRKIPVYIIRDYSISIYGAANAGWIEGCKSDEPRAVPVDSPRFSKTN